ncbi:MAG: HmuY family protein [Muribaculaceae bacterium]|nr:HmuY family protein [Muribaculaceae bacterium]
MKCLVIAGAAMLSGCQGILSGVYDDLLESENLYIDGQLYIDASDWGEWHYIDLAESYPHWQTYEIPCSGSTVETVMPQSEESGIYTYRYDVFGAGISNYEFREFTPTPKQSEPADWTFAVHRNNVRTNGVGVYETSYTSIAELPDDLNRLEQLDYTEDEWNQTDVWAVQDRMLSGIIGNQGIYINSVLGEWLKMEIPPMPPAFSLNNHVFILKLKDGTFAALQLVDYMSASGTKCCLTINYKYPI